MGNLNSGERRRRPRGRQDTGLELDDRAFAQVSAIGPKTRTAAEALQELLRGSPVLQHVDPFPRLAAGLEFWADEEASVVLEAVREYLGGNRHLDPDVVGRWIKLHPSDGSSVRDCLLTDPPPEIEIISMLSRAGSQKLVFLANWRIAQKEVVLKKFIDTQSASRLYFRELQPHPLSMQHPNIMETHKLTNDAGEPFLVERRLPLVLDDKWRSMGIGEVANLLRDIASALAFLDDCSLIHGDVKPANIGFENSRYVLLDFDVCRTEEAFAQEPTPTGSLRTRAPELLLGTGLHTRSSDVWALGATVYNAVVGRFPLFEPDQAPPRVSHPAERLAFETELRRRAQQEWDKRVDLRTVPEPLVHVLSPVLAFEPGDRPTAAEVVRAAD